MGTTIEQYLSEKFNRDITRLQQEEERLLFSYDSKRILKLIPKNTFTEDVDLYKYLYENYQRLPIAKIYSIGEIQVPKNLLFEKEYIYKIIEKVYIPYYLVKELEYMDSLVNEVERFCDIFLGVGLLSGIGYILRKNKNTEDKLECIRDYFKRYEPIYSDRLDEVIDLIKTLYKDGIYWVDIHPGQFGINTKGELVSFDLDTTNLKKSKNPYIKTKIKESKLLNFKEFMLLESNNLISQLSKEIKNGKKFFFKYIENYPQKEDKKSYKPISIDSSGRILIDIDGELYYSKANWVEGIEEIENENLQNYPLTPELTEPPKGPDGYSMGDLWKQDKEFDELIDQNGGMKKTIKKIKRLYGIDYSHCKKPMDLYQNLKVDGFLS
jgi:hypothetical protein